MKLAPINSKVVKSAGVYFAAQGLAVIGWWSLLLFQPGFRHYFYLDADSGTSLMAFWMADILLLGVGSLVVSWLCFRRSQHVSIAAWFVTGAITYASLYCFAFVLLTDLGWLGIVLMFPATIWSGVFSVGISFGKQMFRQASPSPTSWVLTKTLVQIVVIWSVILVVMPYLITIVEGKIGIIRLQFDYQHVIAAALFAASSAIGIWAAVTMSRQGLGTPLPLDHANKLVIVGPYAYVRNPMAVTGIGQGLSVALFLGSSLVMLYALMGSLIWQFVFRPLEESDLQVRFGTEYERYHRQVGCWVPRTTAYHSDGAVDSSNSSVSPVGRM
jgi:protein-S-isoprenylcysteine O-methyltransferase Ste14